MYIPISEQIDVISALKNSFRGPYRIRNPSFDLFSILPFNTGSRVRVDRSDYEMLKIRSKKAYNQFRIEGEIDSCPDTSESISVMEELYIRKGLNTRTKAQSEFIMVDDDLNLKTTSVSHINGVYHITINNFG